MMLGECGARSRFRASTAMDLVAARAEPHAETRGGTASAKRRRRRAHALGGWGETHARNFANTAACRLNRRVGMAFDGGRASAARGSLATPTLRRWRLRTRGVGRHARVRGNTGLRPSRVRSKSSRSWEETRRIAHGGVVEVHPASREDAFRSKATWDDERDARLAAEAANTRSLWESTADGEWERSRTTLHVGVDGRA